MTPDVLITGSSNRSAELGVKHAFNAFHQAHREGFRLQVQFRLIILLLPYKQKLHKSGKQSYRATCITKKQILEHLRWTTPLALHKTASASSHIYGKHGRRNYYSLLDASLSWFSNLVLQSLICYRNFHLLLNPVCHILWAFNKTYNRILLWICYFFQDVGNAKLAQRRRLKKKSSNDVRSCSNSSSFSSSSSSGEYISIPIIIKLRGKVFIDSMIHLLWGPKEVVQF